MWHRTVSPALGGRFLTTEPPGKFGTQNFSLVQIKDECSKETEWLHVWQTLPQDWLQFEKMRPNSIVGWNLLGRIFLINKTDTIRDFLFLWTLWCVGWKAINNFGTGEASWKWSRYTDEERNKRGAERTESQSLASTKDIQPLRFQLYEQVLLGFSVACSQMDPNQYSSDYTLKTTRETKRQGNQWRPGSWPHFCLAPLSQST